MAQDKAADLSLSNVPSAAKPDATTPLRLAEVTPEVTSLTTPIDQRVSPGHQAGAEA